MDGRLYAGTLGGVWSRSLSEVLTSLDGDITYTPDDIFLEQYPNPFHTSTTFFFTLPSHEFVTLDIYDLSGTRIKRLISENLASGAHSVVWDAKGVPEGMYICKLTTGKHVQLKQVVVSD